MPVAEVNGQKLYYTDTGGDGPAIVFSHGFLMSGDMFAPQVAEFGDEYRVITWDWRGFGRTEACGNPFTVWDQARDLIGLLDHLGIESAILGGMSHGGYISMRVPLLAPERVRALILMDTSASGLTPEERVSYKAMFDRWATEGPTDELTGIFADLIIGHPDHNEVWRETWRSWPKERMVNPSKATVEAEDIRPRLGEITCPAIVIHGEDDAAFPVDLGEEIAKHLPGAGPVAVVPGAHAANLTHPETVNPEIRTFLGTL